jgi:hypothetical protein
LVPQRHVAVLPCIAEKLVPISLRHHVVGLKVLRGVIHIHHGLAVLALVDHKLLSRLPLIQAGVPPAALIPDRGFSQLDG